MPHNETHTKNKLLTPRKLALLATVGAIAGAFLVVGPGNFSLSNLASTQPAQAAEQTAPVASGPFQAPTGFADLVAKVKPAVISVRVRIEESMNGSHISDQQIPPGLQKFFQQFGFPNMQSGQNGMSNGKEMITGLGSGFFISPDGYAVTNNHVVEHAKAVEIKTENGQTYKAKVIGTDPKTDLALIKVDSDKTFPYVKFAEHEPRIGDWVVAIGNPFGLSETVTAGIVSAKNRDIGGSSYDDYIQIDAHQQGQLRRPGLQHQRQCDRRQHRNLLAVGRLGRHRLRHSGLDREGGSRPAQDARLRQPCLSGRQGAAGDRRHC
jgi:serine protease Do